jgi:hypothetical protein
MGFVKYADQWHEVDESAPAPPDPAPTPLTRGIRRPQVTTLCCKKQVLKTVDPSTGMPWAAPIDDSPLCSG